MPYTMQDIVSAMKEIGAVMDPEEDYQTVVNAEHEMNMRNAKQEEEMKESRRKLQVLAGARKAAKKAATRPANVPSAAKHVSILKELDSENIALVKGINQAEMEHAAKEEEIKRLREEIAEFEATDEADKHPVDGTALRLAIYNGMGFEPILNKDGGIQKLIVRSRSGDVHCIALDDPENVPDTATLWKLAAS